MHCLQLHSNNWDGHGWESIPLMHLTFPVFKLDIQSLLVLPLKIEDLVVALLAAMISLLPLQEGFELGQ